MVLLSIVFNSIYLFVWATFYSINPNHSNILPLAPLQIFGRGRATMDIHQFVVVVIWIVFYPSNSSNITVSKQPPHHQHKHQQLQLHKASCDLLLVMLKLCDKIICITQNLRHSVLASQDHQSLPDSPEAGQLLCLRAKPLTFSTWKGYSNFF